jgi:hypothetical protein
MLNLFAFFNLGPTELIVIGFLGCGMLVVAAVVVLIVVLLTRGNKQGPGNE